MFEVLAYLYENFPALAATEDADALERKLAAAGFERDDIDEALAWLRGLAQVARSAQSLRAADRRSQRIYPSYERERLGAEGVAFLAFLESVGQLSAEQRELVIERALAGGEREREWPVPVARLKLIVLMVLWCQQAEIDLLLVEELLDDGEDRLLN